MQPPSKQPLHMSPQENNHRLPPLCHYLCQKCLEEEGESVLPTLRPSSHASMGLSGPCVPTSKETALEVMASTHREVIVYSDGSALNGQIGAAVVLYKDVQSKVCFENILAVRSNTPYLRPRCLTCHWWPS